MSTSPASRMRILLSAYACGPDMGSEPGTAWSWIQELSRHVDVAVVTRANNQPAIDDWLLSRREHSVGVEWLYVDAPAWILWLKRRTGAIGVYWYYPLWQMLALFRARRLLGREPFDVAHHVSFMDPRFAMVPLLPMPSVVGPFGGLQPLAKGFLGVARHRMLETVRAVRNACRRLSPVWRWQLSRTDAIIAANSATQAALPARARTRSVLMQIGTHEIGGESPSLTSGVEEQPSNVGARAPIRVLWGGVHIGWKGLELLLRAIPKVQERVGRETFEVIVTGGGPDSGRLRRVSTKLGIADSVHFVDWVDRETYRALLQSSDIFVFTSLRETTGAALLEAMGHGKPTLVLDHGGPAEITTEETSIKIPPESPQQAIERLAEGLVLLISDPALRHRLGTAAHDRIKQEYSWPVVVERTMEIYRSVLGSGA
jgi:glycosyltransferase involved in cell wall biosynthesis